MWSQKEIGEASEARQLLVPGQSETEQRQSLLRNRPVELFSTRQGDCEGKKFSLRMQAKEKAKRQGWFVDVKPRRPLDSNTVTELTKNRLGIPRGKSSIQQMEDAKLEKVKLSGVTTPFITGTGPPCRIYDWHITFMERSTLHVD